MKIRWLAAFAAMALWCVPAKGQNAASGSISASSTNCTSVPSSCVWESPLPPNAATSTINISGTFSATLLVEESNNGGTTWSTAATLSSTGTTTYSVNGFTDIRVRCSAFTSGTAAVTISTGLNAGPMGPAGPAGGGITSVSANQLDPTQSPYNVKADAKSGNDGSITIGTNVFSSTNQSCVTADTGKLIIAVTNTSTGQYAFNNDLATITGCSGNSWTTSENAAHGAASGIYWGIGTGNGAGLQSAYTAAIAAGKILALPCGAMIVESPPFIGPASINWITSAPDVKGCNATMGTKFILHPNITAWILASGGPAFASDASPIATGTISYNGLNCGGKAEDLFLTALSGAIPGNSGIAYSLFNGFCKLDNIAITGVGATNGTWSFATEAGESHFSHLNFQNVFNPSGFMYAVNWTGQGTNSLFDSIIAYGFNAAVQCNGAFCELDNDYLTIIQNGVVVTGPGSTVKVIGTILNGNSSQIGQGMIYDGNYATTFLLFSDIVTGPSTQPGIRITNSGSVVDISGTTVTASTAGNEVIGAGQVNDRAGNTWTHPLTQLTGKYVPIGGGSVANNTASAATNFGTNLGSTNVLGGVTPGVATYDIKIGFRQVTAGVGCSASSNTVNGVLSWTSGGVTQSTGSGGVPALGTLTITGNGSVGSSSSYSSQPVHIDINTQVTFTTTSTLASTGCTTTPQYVVDFSNI